MPNLIELFFVAFDKGGILMWPILFVSVVVWSLGFERLWVIRRIASARKTLMTGDRSISEMAELKDDAFRRLRSRFPEFRSGRRDFHFHYREFLLSVVPELEAGFSSMSAWISVAPLLGLLGTVMGMVHTFRAIMRFGIGNPHLMAEGISIALLTTQAGLTVAFPALLFHNYLLSRRNWLIGALIRDGEWLAKENRELQRIPNKSDIPEEAGDESV